MIKHKKRSVTSLSAALEKGTDKTKQEIAREAKVSTRTVLQVLDRTYATDPSPGNCSARQLSGYTEALTRLALYSKLIPENVLREYDIKLEWPGVRIALERVSGRQFTPPVVPDPILTGIEKRGGKVRAGLLKWPPWAREGQGPDDSWAGRYVRRLLCSVNPFWQVEMSYFDRFGEVVRDLVDKDRLDLAFGLYDMSYRRVLGLNFIHLPGLGVPLDALSVQETGESSHLTWHQILDPESRARQSLHAVVIREEAAHILLQGAGGYDAENLTTVDDSDFASLAAKFANMLALKREVQRKAIFVADRTTCQLVRQKLQEQEKLGSALERLAVPGERIRQSLRLAASVATIPKDDAPVYRVGIAVRADANRWETLLDMAQTQDLFRDALRLTAKLYGNLLSTPESSFLQAIPPQPLLSSPISQLATMMSQDINPLLDLTPWTEPCKTPGNTGKPSIGDNSVFPSGALTNQPSKS